MSGNKISIILPIKEVSERLPRKNFLLFDGLPLYEFMVEKLLKMKCVLNIYISTDSETIKTRYGNTNNRVVVIDRPDYLLGNHITGNSIFDHVFSLIDDEHVLQTHCTNPLLTEHTIEMAVKQYFDNLNESDSLFSVDRIQKRAYDVNSVALNHSNDVLLPTQELPPVLVENSNLFIFSRTSFYKNNKSRIGATPRTFEMHPIEGMDVDYEEEFNLAKLIFENRQLFPKIFI